jgi:uncharacterized protein with HEPN domain
MYPSQLEFIQHIEEEASYILRATQGKTRDQILDDETLIRAVIRSFEVIGEATKNINSQLKNRYPQIDWKVMAGMRDRLIHHYFGIDYEVLYNTIIGDVPELHYEIQRVLMLESGGQQS